MKPRQQQNGNGFPIAGSQFFSRRAVPGLFHFLAAALVIFLTACSTGSRPNPEVPQLQLGLRSTPLMVGNTLLATVSLHGFPLSTADVAGFNWSSDDPTVATASAGGVITGVSAGTTIIRVNSPSDITAVREGYATIVVLPPDPSPAPSGPPSIEEFSAEGPFRAGTGLTLTWSVQHAESVLLELELEADGQWTEVFQSPEGVSQTTVRLPLNSALLNFRLTALNDAAEETSQLLAETARPVSGWICNEPDRQIEITDPAIEVRVRTLYGIGLGPILCGEVQQLLESRVNDEEGPLQETANMLNLNGVMDTGSLEGIQHLIYLSRLELMHNGLRDIHPLHGLASLTELNLDVNDISDLSPLAGLNNLQVIGLYRNEVSDLQPLAALSELRILFLSENAIRDLLPLQRLTKLEHLWLFQNCENSGSSSAGKARGCLSDLAPIEALHSLKTLLIKGNEITSLTPVANLSGLELLEASDNLIEDLSPLRNLQSLRTVTLDDNPIQSLAPLIANSHFPAGVPYRFKRGTAKLPLGAPYPNLGLGYNCIQDDPAWEAHLATFAEREADISGAGFLQNIRGECSVPAGDAAEFEGQNMRLLLRQLQLRESLQRQNRVP